jgi:hypothetical protein
MASLFNFQQPYDLNAARSNLAQQVSSGGINQAQMDAELGRLQGLNSQAQTQQPAGQAPSLFGVGSMPSVNISNPQGALQSQAQINQWLAQQNASLNRVNETNPFGSSSYVTNPDGTISRETTLNKGQQGLLNQQVGRDTQLGKLAGALAGKLPTGQLNLSGLPQISGMNDLSAQRRTMESDLMSEYERRNAPEFERQRAAMEQRLADQGIGRGNSLYNSELERLERQIQDARLGAQSQASVQAGDEMSRQFGIESQARQGALGEMLTQRGLPYQELQGILGMQQGATLPQFSAMTPVQMGNLDVMGLYGQEQAYGLSQQQLAQQMEIARMNNATAGKAAGGRTDPFALARLQNDLAMQRDQQQFENEMRLAGQNDPSIWEQVLPIVGSGIGSAIGSYNWGG